MNRCPGLVATGVLLGSMAGCGASEPGDPTASQETTLTVFAAASLTDAFTELGRRFEKAHEGLAVTFNFAGSSDLVAQLQQGAPADVFASADTSTMDTAVADDLVAGTPVSFASNTLQIAVPPGNPAGVQSLADLADPDLNVVVCAPVVPCGAAATVVEQRAGIDIRPVSEEASVTDVLSKVASGEADAGLVYVTDILGAGGDVEGIEFPQSDAAVNVYPIATLSASEHGDVAREFVDLVTSPAGQSVLADAGFAAP